MARSRPFSLKLFSLLLAGAASLTGAGAIAPAAAQDANAIRYFRIGTGSTGGTYFPVGGMIATIISKPKGSRPCDRGGSCGVEGLIGVAQASRGSVDNIRQIVAGTIESGLAQADVAYWAYNGQRGFKAEGKLADLRIIASLYPEKVHLVVPASSPIKSLGDLAGKRVSVGEKGSGTLAQVRLILAASGLAETQLQASYTRPQLAADDLRKNRLDAFFIVAGEPTTVIVTLSDAMPIRLVSIDDETVSRLVKAHPYFRRSIVAANTYRNVPVAGTIAVQAQWLVSAKIDDETVYGLTRALWSKPARKLLDTGHPEGKRITLETALDGVNLPLHPGAARYYREIGKLKD